MANILILGDSHTTKLGYISEDWFRANTKSEKIVTGNSHFHSQIKDENNYTVFMKDTLVSYENDKSKMFFSGHSGRSAYSYDFVNFASGTQKDMLEKWDVEGNIFIPWLGYIDCRNHLPNKDLPNYATPKDVVKQYIKNVTDNFKNCQIVFMEPVPQFITIVTSDWRFPHLDPNFDFELRHEEYLEFIKELRIQCAENGLPEPINTSDILGTDMIESWMQPKKPINRFLNDHMSQEHYKKILAHIYNVFK